MAGRLDGCRILILEAREEAQFSRLLAEQGAEVLQCPMFGIADAPDAASVEAWIRRFVAVPCDDLVLTTGEGLRRLVKAAERYGLSNDFIAALGRTRTLARGPKPGRALREIGLHPLLVTEKPTTEGIIELLATLELAGRRVGVQLYPDKEHGALLGAIAAGGATADPVTPYAYDARAADANVLAAIDEMARGAVDAIALTASAQVRRLFDVARAHHCEDRLRAALTRTRIASIGPAVADELALHDLSADITPVNEAFFMKPLISAMASALAPT
jgi:uroporphyrinogen-III synthase